MDGLEPIGRGKGTIGELGGSGTMARDGKARWSSWRRAYGLRYCTGKAPKDREGNDESNQASYRDAEQTEAALCLAKRTARRRQGFNGAVRLEARQ